MKKMIWITTGVLLAIGAGALYKGIPSEAEIKTVQMTNPQGEPMGVIRLSENAAGVLLDLDLAGLTPNGDHAIHFHETGQCNGAQGFKTAGGHYNPTEKSHGMKHPEGHHAGDMPNLKPNEKGVIQNGFMNLKVTLGESTDKRHTLYDADGSAIIIHAGADDHMSQPSGAAGARIACGVVN